jgi:hypothetical protein
MNFVATNWIRQYWWWARYAIDQVDFTLGATTERIDTMSDFTIMIGHPKVATPIAKAVGGGAVPFPPNAVFAWVSSATGEVAVSNGAVQTPTITGVRPMINASLRLTVTYDGFSHTILHTVDVVPAPPPPGPVDPIDTIDFTLA